MLKCYWRWNEEIIENVDNDESEANSSNKNKNEWSQIIKCCKNMQIKIAGVLQQNKLFIFNFYYFGSKIEITILQG